MHDNFWNMLNNNMQKMAKNVIIHIIIRYVDLVALREKKISFISYHLIRKTI